MSNIYVYGLSGVVAVCCGCMSWRIIEIVGMQPASRLRTQRFFDIRMALLTFSGLIIGLCIAVAMLAVRQLYVVQ